jgi:hypothetical protein
MQAHADIDAEPDMNDWVRAIVDVLGVGGGVVGRMAELDLPVVSYNGGEAPIETEQFVNARAEDYWALRERFEHCSSALTAPLSWPLDHRHSPLGYLAVARYRADIGCAVCRSITGI